MTAIVGCESRVQAGFPSPAEDCIEHPLDLNEYLVRNPSATFLVRVSGDSMTGAGIFSDNLLVVDRSLTPCNGDIVIAILDGDFTVKRLVWHGEQITLMAENPDFPPIPIGEPSELCVWGVVRYAIHALRAV